nr:MAG TPA: hypothetical protein [Caudoviricetes sp.]
MSDVERRLFMLCSNLFVDRFKTYKKGEYYIVGGNKWKINLYNEA